LAWRPYARPLAGFKGVGSRWRGLGKGKGEERNGKGEEGQEEKGGWEESWNRAADWLRPALTVCAHIGVGFGELRRSPVWDWGLGVWGLWPRNFFEISTLK